MESIIVPIIILSLACSGMIGFIAWHKYHVVRWILSRAIDALGDDASLYR